MSKSKQTLAVIMVLIMLLSTFHSDKFLFADENIANELSTEISEIELLNEGNINEEAAEITQKTYRSESQIIIKYKDARKADVMHENIRKEFRNLRRRSTSKGRKSENSNSNFIENELIISKDVSLEIAIVDELTIDAEPAEEMYDTASEEEGLEEGIAEQDVFAENIIDEDTKDEYIIVNTVDNLNIEILEITDDYDIDEVIQILKKDENIEYVQKNYAFALLGGLSNSNFDKQWALKNVGQEVNGRIGISGIDISMDAIWEYTYPLETVVVGVLDAGIDTKHKSLAGKFVDGWDFVNSDASVFDNGDTAHGTQIAGIIAANEDEAGVMGVSRNVKIMPLKFVEDGYGFTSDAIDAIEYASKRGVKIINCSWGSGGLTIFVYISESDIFAFCC